MRNAVALGLLLVGCGGMDPTSDPAVRSADTATLHWTRRAGSYTGACPATIDAFTPVGADLCGAIPRSGVGLPGCPGEYSTACNVEGGVTWVALACDGCSGSYTVTP